MGKSLEAAPPPRHVIHITVERGVPGALVFAGALLSDGSCEVVEIIYRGKGGACRREHEAQVFRNLGFPPGAHAAYVREKAEQRADRRFEKRLREGRPHGQE